MMSPRCSLLDGICQADVCKAAMFALTLVKGRLNQNTGKQRKSGLLFVLIRVEYIDTLSP